MERKECVGLLGLQAALKHCLSCHHAKTHIPTTYFTKDRHLRTIWNWKEIGVFIVSFLTFILLISVRRLYALISLFYLYFNVVFHFKFLRGSVSNMVRVTEEWCKIITTWKRVLPDEITSLKKALMFLKHLRQSINLDILKWLAYWQVLFLESVVTSVRTVWLCMTESSGRLLHIAFTKITIDCINKLRILNNRQCSPCKQHGLLHRTNRVAAVCISSLKNPFRCCKMFKVTAFLLMVRPSPTFCIAAFNDDSARYPSSIADGASDDMYDGSYELSDPPFGVLPGYRYAYNPRLPDKVMTEGVIICLLAGTAFVGLVIWLAKTNFKESQQRRMRREASLRDRTLLVQNEDDIV